jgi:hypothetical protein
MEAQRHEGMAWLDHRIDAAFVVPSTKMTKSCKLRMRVFNIKGSNYYNIMEKV